MNLSIYRDWEKLKRPWLVCGTMHMATDVGNVVLGWQKHLGII